MRSNFTRLTSLGLSVAALSLTASSFGAAPLQATAADGFRVSGTIDLERFCGAFPAIHTYLDGSTLIFDGRRIQYTTSDGLLLRDYATLAMDVFPTFMKVTPDGSMAYFGESSTGTIRSLDLTTGELRVLTSFTFNYDMALDVVPGLAYVSASAFGSATNSVFLLDLQSGQSTQVADIGGFAGPLEVDSSGNLYVAALPSSFPFPADATKVVRFDAAQLNSGVILTDEADGFDYATGFDGMSSADYDARTDALVVIETNTGASGSDSIIWKLDSVGQRESVLAQTGGYTSGVQVYDVGTGARLAAYQPASTSVRFAYRECNSTGDYFLWNVTPQRPIAFFSGPDPGMAGTAAVEVFRGPANGFASLWLARSGGLLSNELFAGIGGTHPVALAATVASFGRRFPMVPLDATGSTQLMYQQSAVLQGAALFQWVVFDSSMQIVGTSNYVLN